MKQQDLAKYHNQTIQELETEVQKMQLDLVDTKMKQSTGQIKNLHASKTIRQDIARLKTIIRHKQLVKDKKSSQPKESKPAPAKTTKTVAKPATKSTKSTKNTIKTTKKVTSKTKTK